MNIKAVGHTMVDPAIELDATLLQERQLLKPRFPVWQGHCDVADRAWHPGHGPFGRRRREARVLDQCQVVVAQGTAAVIAAVEAHLRRMRARRTGFQLAHLLEADDLGPEFVRFLEIAHIEDQMVEPNRRHRFVCHLSASFPMSHYASIERLGLYGQAPVARVRSSCAFLSRRAARRWQAAQDFDISAEFCVNSADRPITAGWRSIPILRGPAWSRVPLLPLMSFR